MAQITPRRVFPVSLGFQAVWAHVSLSLRWSLSVLVLCFVSLSLRCSLSGQVTKPGAKRPTHFAGTRRLPCRTRRLSRILRHGHRCRGNDTRLVELGWRGYKGDPRLHLCPLRRKGYGRRGNCRNAGEPGGANVTWDSPEPHHQFRDRAGGEGVMANP